MKRLVVILLLLTNAAFASVKVVDGDSLEIDSERIRMDGIDAPEFFQTCRNGNNEDYNCGQEALAHLQKLIGKKDIKCDCLPQTDKYHRRICECFVGDISLNRQMVKDGYARSYRSEKFEKDEEKAEKAKLGIWQGKHMRPALYRILQKFKS